MLGARALRVSATIALAAASTFLTAGTAATADEAPAVSDLLVKSEASADQITAGDSVEFAFTVVNFGPDPASSATVHLTPPPAAESSTIPSGCVASPPGSYSCSLTGFKPGGLVVYLFTSTTRADFEGSSLTASGTIDTTSTDSNLANNSTSVSVAVSARPPDVVGPVDPVTSTPPASIDRWAGVDRIGTAVAVSQQSFPAADSAGAVIVARSDRFPDALAATPLAVAKNAPILLSPPSMLDGRTLSEIDRVLPSGGTVYLLGQTAALDHTIDAALDAAGYTVVRLGGADRYETAALIATAGLGEPTTVLLATGVSYADALAAGAAAGHVHAAVLLTDGTDLPAATAWYLSSHRDATVYALGIPAASAYPGAIVVAGADRYETARLTAERFFTDPASVVIASGVGFADALVGGAAAARQGAPILLTAPDALSPPVAAYLTAHAQTVRDVTILGGEAAIRAAVEVAVADALR